MTYAYDNSEHAHRREELAQLRANWESLQAEIAEKRERLAQLYKEEEALRAEAKSYWIELD